MAEFLVTGGCGFIGSHLCEALAAQGHSIRVLDDLSSGSLSNLVPGSHLIQGSVADPVVVARAMDGVAGCFHLAAVASVQKCTEAWLPTHQVNLSGTINVFEAARRGAIPVVYASSAAVYGAPDECPLVESAPLRPLSAYGADKLGCELHARVAGEVHNVPTIGLRFFNVFGPRQDPRSPYSGVISIFCERLARDQPVTIHGDGGQTRDFVHVFDVVAALIAALPVASLAAPVLNVCTGRPTSIMELAAAVAAVCGRTPNVTHAPARVGDIRESVGAPGMLKSMLKIEARVALEEGLAGVMKWLDAGCPPVAPQPNTPRSTTMVPNQRPAASNPTAAAEVRTDQR
jgi:UDP-glucose 4-epimerase